VRDTHTQPVFVLVADLSYHGMGRHLFIDVAVVEPASPAMTGGACSSAEHAGWGCCCLACPQKKHSKYRDFGRRACLRIDSTFRDGLIERYGHCGLCGSLRVRGIGNRGVVFGAVMSDAAMLDAVHVRRDLV
jgi:hypothetical protein